MPHHPKDPPLLLKIEEAAQMLGVSRSALYRDVKLRGRWATCTVPYGRGRCDSAGWRSWPTSPPLRRSGRQTRPLSSQAYGRHQEGVDRP